MKEFEEVAHSGGTVTFRIKNSPENGLQYQVGYSSSRPVPMVMVGLYALLADGYPISHFRLGGIGQNWDPPPLSGCVPVFLVSDSQGRFGHLCPQCGGYWRGEPHANCCAYCATRGQPEAFLSESQRRYVEHWCSVLRHALLKSEEDDIVIDMDSIAEATEKGSERPDFYVSEEQQQHQFKCAACGGFNDILGRYGYCGSCGTRNDFQDFEQTTTPRLRDLLNNSEAPEDCLRDAVAEFESFVTQLAHQLAEQAWLTTRRKAELKRRRYHDLGDVAETLKQWFDIDMKRGVSAAEWECAVRMFHRRHVYEHKGGEVDKKYLDDTGDTSVRLKQRLRETQEGVHDLLSTLLKFARNMHRDFHDIFPPIPEPIERTAREERRRNEARRSR